MTAREELGPCPPFRDGQPISWPLYAEWQKKRAEAAEALLREAMEKLLFAELDDPYNDSDDLRSRVAAHLEGGKG